MEKQKGTPLVSVVMCCYNAEKHVAESIRSILGQTYTHLELIIWNDGSSDHTEEIIKSFADERIRYFFHENTGIGEAANLACRHAVGEYIARIDSDDIAEPERIAKEVEYMEHHPKCVLLSSAVTYIDEAGHSLARSYPYTWNYVLKRCLTQMYNPISHPACIFRSSAFRQVTYPHIHYLEDAVMFRRLSKMGEIHNLSEPLLKYRISANSLSHSLGHYASLLLHAGKIVADSDSNELKQNEALFNAIYSYAKKNSQAQDGGFYNDHIFRLSQQLSFLPSRWVSGFIILIHNILGVLKYGLFV